MIDGVKLPPESFRITEPGGKFYVVHVASDRAAMLEVMRSCRIDGHPDQLAACISGYSEDLEGFLGMLLFERETVRSGLVAHELAHAAFRVFDHYSNRVEHWERAPGNGDGLTLTHPTEETYCEVLEHMTRQFWSQWYANDYGLEPGTFREGIARLWRRLTQ